MDNPIDGKQLDVVVQMAFYMPFDTTNSQGGLEQGVSILSSTRGPILQNMFLRRDER
jgi:hypothetical protein